MTREEFAKILDDASEAMDSEWTGDNAFQGLQIIAKYFDSKTVTLIKGASDDQIFSFDIDELIEAGITQEDAKELARLNWHHEDESLACFV